jgi:hypothetical protein
MSKSDQAKIEQALAHVDESRRGFLKGLLLGSAALAALPLIKSDALAQDQGGGDAGKGEEGKGKGKKGKKGKKGEGGEGGDEGKGKGDN